MNFRRLLALFLMFSLSTQTFAISIALLIKRGRIPAIQNNKLNLSGLNIDNLAGLADIPGIENVEVLGLNNNDLIGIPQKRFQHAKV
jgi:hypothetical protein